MNVGITPKVAVGALDDGNRAVLAACNAPIRQALAVVGRHGVYEDAQDLATASMMEGCRQATGHCCVGYWRVA